MRTSQTPASQRLRVLAGCLSILLVAAGLQGCKKQAAPQGQGTPGSGTAGPAATPKADTVVARVNGSPIMESALDKRIMGVISSNMGGNLSRYKPELIEQYKKMLRPQALDEMIAWKLVDQQVEAAGIKVTDKDVEAAVNELGPKQNPPMNFDQYKKRVLESGQDFNDVMQELKTSLARQKFLEPKLAGKVDVNEAQAKAFYDANKKDFQQAEEVRASHILIMPSTSDPNTDPNKARLAAKEKAQKAADKIKAGADFAAVAKTDSNDPGSAANGGDVGFFARGEMEKAFEDAAFGLEPNQVSGPVETRYGYHIIKQTGHKQAGLIPFDEVKEKIIQVLSDEARGQALREYVQSLRPKAKIEYTSPSDKPPALDEVPPAAAPAKPQAEAAPSKPADANQPKRPADANQANRPADANQK